MAVKQIPTWIVVLDGAQARFFTLRQGEEGQIFEETAEALTASVRSSEKPGRSFSTGKARGVVEPRKNARKLEKHDFVQDVAQVLDAAVGQRTFARLVLVAPPRTLGELREVLTERVLETLTHEVPKTFTKLSPDALWRKLSDQLLMAAKPLSKKIKGDATPGVPVSVVFRSTEASPAVKADALRYAAKLARKFSRVESCKVTISAPRRVSLKGKAFAVALDVTADGRSFTTKSEMSGLHTHENAHAALRDVFDAVERLLAGSAGRKASAAKPSRSSAKRSKRIVDEE